MSVYLGKQFFEDQSFPFHIDQYRIEAGEHIPLHTHEFVEMVYVVSGSAEHRMAGLTYSLRPRDVFIIEPNVYHSYQGLEKEETIVYNVLFDLSLLRRELDLLSEIPSFLEFFYLTPFLRKTATFTPYLSVDRSVKGQLEQHLETMQHELKAKESGYQLIIKTRLIECMVLLSRYFRSDGGHRPAHRSDEEWLQSAASLLEQHYDQPFSLEQLSSMCGMSVSSFTSKFKHYFGKSTIEYRHDVQIKKACRLLLDGRQSIIDVANEVGFKDLSFFYKVFRKNTGLTPSAYRRKQLRP